MRRTVSGAAASTGGVLLALLSSACCVGPLSVALSLVGLSGGALLTMENLFGPYRPYMLIGTTLVLALGFYTAYRPHSDCCRSDKSCGSPGVVRLQRISLWFAALLMLTLLYFTYIHPNLDVYFGIYL